MSSLRWVKLSKEEKNLFAFLAFMERTKSFDKQAYNNEKKKFRIFLYTVGISLILPIIILILGFKPEIFLSFMLAGAMAVGVSISTLNPIAEDDFFIRHFVREFSQLREIKPDLTVREYFEKSKAELMTQYQQKENERLDAIKERAKQIGVL